ncbi:hypothetical protein [uncultured Aquimarina sp.]|uniref:hypothetical protein n=1 Tax=uncultured Aquimarina sp. TaxID=575652 RepID=UPI0026342109|nr:hypothetical protein [uncultured Aquimarina sp.]
MKKITLILVAAIFAIGTQSCSTDDKTNFIGDQIPENAIKMTRNSEQKSLNAISPCFEKIFVVYPAGSNDQDNLNYVSKSLKFKFSIIWSISTPYCENIYEWYVPCDEIPRYFCNNNCDTIGLPKTNITVTHEVDETKLNTEDTESDPIDCVTCIGLYDYGFVNETSPDCTEIKNSFN